MNAESLPIHLIRQYLFCKRIPYFLEILGKKVEYPLWVKQGQEFHEKERFLFAKRTLQRFDLESAEKIFNVFVQSRLLGIHGVLDMLLITKSNIIPIEFKLTTNQLQKSHILQLIAYGKICEEFYDKKFSYGFVVSSQKNKTYKVDYNESLLHELKKIIFNIQESFKNELPQGTEHLVKCQQCEFYNFCNDRE